MCTLQQSTGLKCYQLNAALMLHVVHFTAKLKKIFSYNAQQFNSTDCIELQCIADCWFAVHCNVLNCTAPPTRHCTPLHWIKFLNPLILEKYHYCNALLKTTFNQAALLLLHCAKVWYLIYEYFLFGAVLLHFSKNIFNGKIRA